MTDIHTCGPYCDRLECVKAQRDEMRAELERLRAQEPVAYVPHCIADGEHCIEGEFRFDEVFETRFEVADRKHWECAALCLAAPPAQPVPDPELTQFENDLIESVGQMMRGESVELPVQQWISADHPPTNTQEYVHDLLVRNRYGNVAIVSYDGYAKYFEAESANRLGGHEVVEWRHLPSDFAQPAQRLTDEPQWQPIETAPKDGTQYLACDGKKMWTRNQPPNCYAGDWECNQNRTLWRGHADGLNPTHWMPLPKSPEAI